MVLDGFVVKRQANKLDAYDDVFLPCQKEFCVGEGAKPYVVLPTYYRKSVLIFTSSSKDVERYNDGFLVARTFKASSKNPEDVTVCNQDENGLKCIDPQEFLDRFYGIGKMKFLEVVAMDRFYGAVLFKKNDI